MKQKFICNGQSFKSYDDAIAYCEKNNFRVTNTQTIKKNTFLISITSL